MELPDIPADVMTTALSYVGEPVEGEDLSPREVIATYVARAIIAERLSATERAAKIAENFSAQYVADIIRSQP